MTRGVSEEHNLAKQTTGGRVNNGFDLRILCVYASAGVRQNKTKTQNIDLNWMNSLTVSLLNFDN